jgi:hypothetical protein
MDGCVRVFVALKKCWAKMVWRERLEGSAASEEARAVVVAVGSEATAGGATPSLLFLFLSRARTRRTSHENLDPLKATHSYRF